MLSDIKSFRRRDSQSPEALLKHADDLSWLNAWIQAEPYYRRAEIAFRAKGESSKALYAQVSEMPAKSESSTTIPNQIAVLRQDLLLPAARDPETRLRILTILGMLETNYDAGMARTTWTEVETLALARHHYLLASRAVGEQGIAAFLLGDIKTAKKDVLRAWMVAKFTDPAARIRYASMYGTGLVELHKYKEALGPLNEAIKTAANTPHVAYPTIAITAKIGALSGLGRYQEALQLADEEMRRVSAISSDSAPLRPLPRKSFGLSADERMEPSDWRLSGGDQICEAAFLLARHQRVRWAFGEGLSPSGNAESGSERN